MMKPPEPPVCSCRLATTHQKLGEAGTRHSVLRFVGVDPRTIENMKERVEQCRRLAAFTTDERVAQILLQMADESKADLKRVEAADPEEPLQIIIPGDGPSTRT